MMGCQICGSISAVACLCGRIQQQMGMGMNNIFSGPGLLPSLGVASACSSAITQGYWLDIPAPNKTSYDSEETHKQNILLLLEEL